MVDMLSGSPGALNGTPTWSVDGHMGGVTGYATTGRSAYTRSGPASPASATAAAIFAVDTISGAAANVIVRNGLVGSTVFRSTQTTGLLNFGAGAGAGGLAITAGVPYFGVCSLLGGLTLNAALMNLRTGQLRYESIGTAAIVNATATANQYIGNNDAATAPLIGRIAAVMWAYNRFLSLPELLAWASDPWSFWYPSLRGYRVGISPVAAAGGLGALLSRHRSRVINGGMVLAA